MERVVSLWERFTLSGYQNSLPQLFNRDISETRREVFLLLQWLGGGESLMCVNYPDNRLWDAAGPESALGKSEH